MKRWVLYLLFAGLTVAHSRADELSVLDYMMDKSQCIAVVNIRSKPQIVAKHDFIFSEVMPDAFVEYNFVVDIQAVLHGQGPKESELTARLIRPEIKNPEEMPQLKKDAKCIIFFASPEHGSRWGGTVDGWFSVLPYSDRLVEWIGRLSDSKARRNNNRR